MSHRPISLNGSYNHPLSEIGDADHLASGKISLIVPTNRPERLATFIEAWRPHILSSGVRLIVIEDAAELTAAVPKWAEHFCWADIDEELGANAWIIARRSAAIRSFGLLKAWQHQRPFMITMDDDCLPESDQTGVPFFRAMTAALDRQWPCDSWWNTMRGNVYPRGYPYAVRDCVQETILHHGLWSNIADLDAQTQRELPHYRTNPAEVIERIPTGALFPMSSMNLAFKRKAVPLLFFLLMGGCSGKPDRLRSLR